MAQQRAVQDVDDRVQDPAPRRGRRHLRTAGVVALVLAVVLAVALVVADAAARRYAERNVATEVQRAAELPATPEVEFPGGSFLLQAFDGAFRYVRITAEEASQEGITGRDVEVRIERVTTTRDVLLGRGGTIRAESGRAWATVPYSSLEDYVADRWRDVSITRDDDGVAVTSEVEALGRTQELTVVLDVELDEDTLVLTPVEAGVPGGQLGLDDLRDIADRFGIESPLDGVPVPLRGLPPEVEPERVRVTDDGLKLSARIGAVDLPVTPR